MAADISPPSPLCLKLAPQMNGRSSLYTRGCGEKSFVLQHDLK